MSLVSERVSDTLAEGLPNLKIEIDNDLSQRMETDDDASSEKGASESSETEEGEVVDDDDGLDGRSNCKVNPAQNITSQILPSGRSILKYDTKEYVELQQQTATVKNPNGAFVTGVNIFSPEEQAKLDKRAQRFGIEASEAKVLTEKLLKKLYKSMCVKPTDKNIRTEALHMRGTEQMTTQDVFSYFKDYGPASLEWITDNSCNVVWLDDISAARALLGLSVHISGQTSPSTPPSDPVTQRRSSLSDSDVEMEAQPVDEQVDNTDNLSEESDAVAVSDLEVDLPPGRWRRGAPHPLSPCILLRFATTADRSLPRPGHAKFGSHQFGGYVGLISESRRRRMQIALPTPIIFDDVGDEIIPKPSLDAKDNTNPWGSLAKTWSQFDKVRQPRPPSPIIERILPLPPRMTPPPSPPIFSSRPKLVARRRPTRHATVAITRRSSDDSSESEWCSRSKLPRMRMHADDEEKKIEKKLKKRSRRNRSESHSPARPRDLRKRLGVGGGNHRSDGEESSEPEPVAEEQEEDDEIPDLRVAVAAERAESPEDSKAGIRQSLFQSGNVKSVLRGARGYSENDEEEEKVESEDEEKRTSRRHRSRSKERRRHHRRHKKEGHHKSRRRNSDSDSTEMAGKTVRSTIKRISPEKERRRSESKERKRDKKSPRHEERRRRREESYRRSETGRKSERRRHEESRLSRDLRAKLSHKHKAYDSNNEFRSKSPLQIEIDNDEYYSKTRTVESD